MRHLPLILALAASGCATGTPPRQIGTPDRPIVDDAVQISQDAALLQQLAQTDTSTAQIDPVPLPNQTYTLAELIDIAQRRNPATRRAWYVAREAGRTAGVLESALLPVISASALAGTRLAETSFDLPLFGTTDVSNTASGSALVLSATWLLFDFGENEARQQTADQLARVAELGFNRVHQQVVFDVAAAYHARRAALSKINYAHAAAVRADTLVTAAERRLESGVGNTVEVAQARQLRAQTRLVSQRAEGEARVAAVSLAATLNLPPSTSIRLSTDAPSLPNAQDQDMEVLIARAYTHRPDVLAALAHVRAAQSDLDAQAAAYLPKIYAGGSISTSNADVGIAGLNSFGLGASGSQGVFVGVTIPIYDGNLRDARQRGAQDRVAAAQNGVGVARSVAVREVATAYEALRTALAVHETTLELVRAARVTADAADRAYDAGLGTLSDASAAAIGLYTAQELLTDARFAAHQAAAMLALASGQ